MATYFIEPSPALLLELGLTGDKDQVVNLRYLSETNSRFLKKEDVIELKKHRTKKDLEKVELFYFFHHENLLVNLRSSILIPEKLIGECRIIHTTKIGVFKSEVKMILRDEINLSEEDSASMKEFKKSLIDIKVTLEKQLALKKSFEKRFEKD